jgi:transcriptional regulator with XRE-family HTH domain
MPSRARTAGPAPKDWKQSSLGQRVDHICVLRGWSLKKLGEEAGYDSGVMSRLAARTAATAGAPETLGRVAKAAKVNVLWLMLGEGPVEQVEHSVGMLRMHPDWTKTVAEAKEWQSGIPDEFWELAGDTAFPAPPRLDWQLIVGLVRELYSAHQRWLRESARLKAEPPPSSTESGSGPHRVGAVSSCVEDSTK